MVLPNDASKGLCTSRDPSTLRPGELSEATACEYRVGSPHLYKQAGRSSRSADLGASVQSIARMQYDDAATIIAAVAGGTIYEAADSITPSFTATSITGLDPDVAPQTCGYNERWIMCNGVDGNLIREPDGVTDLGGVAGNWRPNGMQLLPNKLTYDSINSSSTAVRPTASAGDYDDNDRAIDTLDTTYAEGAVGDTSTWAWTTNFASANCTLYIDHSAQGASSGGRGPANPKFDVVDTGEAETSTLLVEYSIDNGVTWHTVTTSATFSRTTSPVAITTGTDIANKLKVRGTLGGTGVGSHKVYDLRVSGGSLTTVTVTHDLYYGYTEVYIDSNGVESESNLSPTTQVTAASVTGKYGAVFTFPAVVNARTVHRNVYRSLDDISGDNPGGAYPALYQVTPVPVAQVTWTDDFHGDLTTPPPSGGLLSVLTVTYPTGEIIIYETNNPPPLATMAVPFSGAIAYVPAEVGKRHRLYYSLAATVSIAPIEKVPFFQYLDFQTPKNDTIISVAVTNGGKSLLAFFANYTMLVNYLPQASDGVFDNRIKEYVSNNRGTAGRLTCCEFTLPAGQTLVASVDALGLWITNGVNQMDEWSRDLDWATDMVGVDLTVAELVDNTSKRRLELLYTDASGNRAERHFFYGRLKEDGDGKPGPIHSGPHPMGVRCKHYTQINSSWIGFSGDSTTTGDVFLENTGYADDANGYDSNGNIPLSFAFGDQYVGGLSKAQIVEQVTSRWGLTPSKIITLEVRLTRDTGHAVTKTKQITTTPGTMSYIHAYGDRARCRFIDISATRSPEFVGQEIDVREGGPSRDA